MKLNNKSKLFLRDIYSYDVEACHYNILKNIGYSLKNIDSQNKLKRNIQIGKLMKNNPNLSKLLRTTTESILDEYIFRSGLNEEDDIITRQYDGLITSKPLKNIQTKIPLKLKHIFDYLIISINRDSYIAKSNNKIIIKGVSNVYPGIKTFFEKLCNINFLNKTQVFVSMEKIKDCILNSEDIMTFFIPNEDETNNYGVIFFKEYGQIQINKNSLNIIDPDDIDREFYFNFYLKPFTESITLEFI
jgi:hypothetical protein